MMKSDGLGLLVGEFELSHPFSSVWVWLSVCAC